MSENSPPKSGSSTGEKDTSHGTFHGTFHGCFRNDLFEKFSFTHAAAVNREPEWLKVNACVDL